jgi:hypothetical protein
MRMSDRMGKELNKKNRRDEARRKHSTRTSHLNLVAAKEPANPLPVAVQSLFVAMERERGKAA